jgi:hypothetical protein
MYTYRKQIQVSQSINPFSQEVINTLDLSTINLQNRIADVEIKATLYDYANVLSSLLYYRNVQAVDNTANPQYTYQKDSSFLNVPDPSSNGAYFDSNAFYVQSTSTIKIVGYNNSSNPVNVLCIIDYKINFY